MHYVTWKVLDVFEVSDELTKYVFPLFRQRTFIFFRKSVIPEALCVRRLFFLLFFILIFRIKYDK